MTYAERLKDPRWQKRRLEILQRDGWRCQECDDKDSTLHVHHRRYVGGMAPWEYPEHELVTLCEGCHGKVTTARKELDLVVGDLSLEDLHVVIGFARAIQFLSLGCPALSPVNGGQLLGIFGAHEALPRADLRPQLATVIQANKHRFIRKATAE